MIKTLDGKTARFAAIETLSRLKRTKLPLPHLFDRVVEECSLKPDDRQLAMKMTYGVLRQREYLDLLLGQLCSQPIGKIKPFAYQALSVGLFQLFFLDRIPQSAAVNETVKALQTAKLPKQIQGFVNGVLRESLRQKQDLPGPEDANAGGTPPLNHPAWMTERWRNHFGTDVMLKICSNNNKEPILSLRVNPCIERGAYLTLLQQQSIAATVGTFAPEAILLPDFQGSITTLPGFREGYFQVQDQAAQLATLLLAPFQQSGTYLDCCAGLGGKTTHLDSILAPTGGLLTALEPDPGRYRYLRENLDRTSEGNRTSSRNETLARFARSCMVRFNGIIVDAPCSGTGVIGRQPDIRWNRVEGDFLSFQQRQQHLLQEAAELLAPGGVLVYATCSIEPEENMEVIGHFLKCSPTFSLSDCRDYLPIGTHNLIRDGCFSPLPGPGIDGFFAARLTSSVDND